MAVEIFKLFGSIFVNNDEANRSISKTDEKASSVASTLGKGVQTAAKWGAAIVGGATVAAGGMLKMAESSASTADHVDKMSQKIGLSRQAYQELDFICSQTGTSVDSLRGGMKTLTNQMDAAAKGNASAKELLDRLGVSIDDGTGKMKSQEDMLYDCLTALQGVNNQTERAALANKLFGKSGTELMPLLNSQSGSIDELKQKAHELGLVMSDELIDSGVGLTDSLDQTKRAFSAIITQLGGAFMPIIKKYRTPCRLCSRRSRSLCRSRHNFSKKYCRHCLRPAKRYCRSFSTSCNSCFRYFKSLLQRCCRSFSI